MFCFRKGTHYNWGGLHTCLNELLNNWWWLNTRYPLIWDKEWYYFTRVQLVYNLCVVFFHFPIHVSYAIPRHSAELSSLSPPGHLQILKARCGMTSWGDEAKTLTLGILSSYIEIVQINQLGFCLPQEKKGFYPVIRISHCHYIWGFDPVTWGFYPENFVIMVKYGGFLPGNTLPETNIAMENPPFWWYLPGKMGIFIGELLVYRRVMGA